MIVPAFASLFVISSHTGERGLGGAKNVQRRFNFARLHQQSVLVPPGAKCLATQTSLKVIKPRSKMRTMSVSIINYL